MKKLKGIITSILLSQIIFLMIPFNIHADTQIVPTYSSSAQTWVNTNGYVYVTNFCEGTTAATNSCKLTFTLNSNWYGMIYIDGYDSSNTQWINYQPVFIADGHGEYNYNFWQSSQKVISKVTVLSINLVKPDTTVDLSQIIQLLTAIENDTSAIDITLDNTLTQITNVLNQLITSNGYLDTLTKLRQWNFPIESFPIVYKFFQMYPYVDFYSNNYYQYPLFSMTTSDSYNMMWSNGSTEYDMVFIIGCNRTVQNQTSLLNNFTFDNAVIKSFEVLQRTDYRPFTIFKVVCNISDSTVSNYVTITPKVNMNVMPIYINYLSVDNMSTDFALRFGLTNSYLDNINIIANGTNQSQSSASDLQQSTDTMQDQMDDMVNIESGYNQQFNNSLNDIDFTNPIQSNAGILPAANFVITVFNGLVNNPLSILIIIICILTIGKKVIGK